MGSTLNRDAWIKLLDEDLEWVRSHPRTLERDHVEQILGHLRGIRPSDIEQLPELTALRAENERLKGAIRDAADYCKQTIREIGLATGFPVGMVELKCLEMKLREALSPSEGK